jgi:predicted  nucleic acid-binding Zn-ribbon protein
MVDRNEGNEKEPQEDTTIFWVKIFGGTVITVTAILFLALAGYIVNNLNNLQYQINSLTERVAQKKDHETLADRINGVSERLNAIEQLSKDRQLWVEKTEARIKDNEKTLENTNKDFVATKERLAHFEGQLYLLREEHKQLQKDLQLLRERVATLEGKK